jgi:quaternary ammonium compound-resistance protein SugE
MTAVTEVKECKRVSSNKGWMMIIAGGAFEPAWLASMKLSAGFTDPLWVAATFVFLFISMYLLAQGLKAMIPMGAAYAVWVGIGAIGGLIAGILLFMESSDPVRLAFVLLIVVGIVGVQLTGKTSEGQ